MGTRMRIASIAGRSLAALFFKTAQRSGTLSGSYHTAQSQLTMGIGSTSGIDGDGSFGSPLAVHLLQVLRAASIAAVATAILVPTGTVAALILTGKDDADVVELFRAVPRTLRVFWWSLWAAYHYKVLAASFAADAITEETYREQLGEMHRRAARRLLKVCQRNGGVYVKAGQLAVSTQAVPPQYREELEGLEDRVPPRPFSDVDRVIFSEFGAHAQEVFAEFDRQATAAASLAQVHKGRTKEGMQVAVKVQYPGLDAAVAADLTTMTAIASISAFIFPASDVTWLFDELRSKLSQELDFRNEASNALRLASCFANRRDVAVPTLVPHLCSRKILCMEWVDGAKVSDAAALRRIGLAPRQVALALLNVAGEMMSVHGFVHGDMHPGNVFVRALPRSGNPFLRLLPWCRRPKPQLVIIDHGLYFELAPNLRQLYCMMWCAFVLNDTATASAAAERLAGPRAGKALTELLRPRDWSAVPPEERRRLRQEAGVRGIRDFTRVLNEAPRQLVDCLRAMALVRHVASRLGATLADRLRCNAVQALHGLQVVEVNRRGRRKRIKYVGVMKSRWRRWQLWIHIAAMRVAAWFSLVVGGGMEDSIAEAAS